MSSAKKFDILRTVLAIVIALIISFGIIFLVSKQPVYAIMQLLTGPLQSKQNFVRVIVSMVPLIFTGTGVCIMFSASQINLASEGAFHIGGLVAAFISLTLTLPAGVSPVVSMIIAALCGGVFTAIPAVMKIFTSADEMVSSLMINYLALYFANFINRTVLRDPSIGSASYRLPESASLGVLMKGTKLHIGIFIAIAVAILGYVFLFKTKLGYELRLTGQNKEFAKYSGINIVKVIFLSQFIGGCIAGLGGGIEILSPVYERFSWQSLLGYGWDAIIICTLAKNNPLFTPFAAFFLAYLRIGASVMQNNSDVSLEIIQITQGIIILFIVAEKLLSKYRHKMIAKEAEAALKGEGAK